jgi:hypothetical protein
MSRDPEKKFVELANKRVNRAIKDLRLIGNLSNKNSYEYSEAQANKIIRALQREMRTLKAKFEGTGDENEDYFEL